MRQTTHLGGRGAWVLGKVGCLLALAACGGGDASDKGASADGDA